MDRPRLTLPLGAGVSRNAGAYVASAATFLDLRNVELGDGRMTGRRGLVRQLQLGPDDLSEAGTLIAIEDIPSAGIAAALVFSNGDTGDPTIRVELWKIDDFGTTATLIGPVWTFGSLPLRLPRVKVAESYGKLFIAHDHVGGGEQSAVYDSGTDLITPLNLGTGMTTPKFRGFKSYLQYMVGWGWGTDADPDRPEIVRVNIPGEPLNWDINHYFVVGQRDDPVLNVDPAGNILMVQKPARTFDIRGTSRENFGTFPGDETVGVISSRASVTVDGVNYRWSQTGPRRSTGGKSEDLGIGLAWQKAQADAAATPSTVLRPYVFAAHDPVANEVMFVMNTDWGFVLHLDALPDIQWSYRTFDKFLRCAGLIHDPAE